jgi:hypothetical protein
MNILPLTQPVESICTSALSLVPRPLGEGQGTAEVGWPGRSIQESERKNANSRNRHLRNREGTVYTFEIKSDFLTNERRDRADFAHFCGWLQALSENSARRIH